MTWYVYEDEILSERPCDPYCEDTEGIPLSEWLDLPNFIDPLRSDFDDPTWIDDLVYGGCAAGTYMPAVEYATAEATMSEHGDEILNRVHSLDHMHRLDRRGWGGLAAFLVSSAVEQYAHDCLRRISELDNCPPLRGL